MKQLKIAFLWHMHQPPYQRGRLEEAVLPWVWLHGLKDYYDMAALLQGHPGMRLNFNFTPSLVEQVENYTAQRWNDPFFELIDAEPKTLSPADKEILLDRFLGLTPGMSRGISAIEQYKEAIQAFGGPTQAAMKFSDSDFLDIQVLFVLAWTGPTLRRQEVIQHMIKKLKGYTMQDKSAVLKAGLQLMESTFPLYKSLSEKGQVELSFSPFYHPLTPLLWSNHLALEADPFVKLPASVIRAPEEVQEQIRLAMEKHESVFGCKPVGMWPPEGAISHHLFPLFKDMGVRWIATDEELLRRSLGGEMPPCAPCFAYSSENLALFFRNKDLSDRIGFLYARWPVKDAVANFMDALHKINDNTPDNALVLIAMDGENAWEFYPRGGYDFLDALYGAIETEAWVEPVLLKDYMSQYGAREKLDVVATGSWIGGNFSTWIGDPTKNRAWEYLSEAYKAYEQSKLDNPELAQKAHVYLLRAEASDWFWWFGEGHSSPDEPQFDLAFRENLQAVYSSLGLPVPDYLHSPVEERELLTPVSLPTDYISPEITGMPDSFYKWTGAGVYHVAQGAIHRLKPMVKTVSFGFDQGHFFFRLQPCSKGDERLINGDSVVQLHMVSPIKKVFTLQKTDGRIQVLFEGDVVKDAEAAYRECLEVKLPVTAVGGPSITQGRTRVECFFVLLKNGLEIERVPWSFNLEFDFNPQDFDLENWTV